MLMAWSRLLLRLSHKITFTSTAKHAGVSTIVIGGIVGAAVLDYLTLKLLLNAAVKQAGVSTIVIGKSICFKMSRSVA